MTSNESNSVEITLDYPTIDNKNEKQQESVTELKIPQDTKSNNDDKFSSIKTTTAQVWTSDITIAEHIELEVTGYILSVCNFLRAHTSGNEFSILCKGEWVKNKYVVSDDFVIPNQKVDRVSVYYDDEDLHNHRSNGYNVVIHCHPFTSNSFSHTDNTTINAHFECSILYSEGSFTTAVIPITVCDGLTIQMKPKQIDINWNTTVDISLSEINSKISVIAPTYTYTKPYVKSYGSNANDRRYYDNYYGSQYDYDNVDTKKKSNSQILKEVNEREQVCLGSGVGIHNGVQFPLEAIDVDGNVIYINEIGKCTLIPFSTLPQNVIYDDVESAFISEEFIYNALYDTV